jgi:hypothetical protein
MVRHSRSHSPQLQPFPTGGEHLLKIGVTFWIMVGLPSPHRLRPLLSMSRVYSLMYGGATVAPSTAPVAVDVKGVLSDVAAIFEVTCPSLSSR